MWVHDTLICLLNQKVGRLKIKKGINRINIIFRYYHRLR